MIHQNVKYKPGIKNNIWRKIAINSWKAPNYSTIYGKATLNPEPALKFLEELNKQQEIKYTLTHFVGRVCGILLERHPELNSVVRLANAYEREACDIFFQVSKVDKNGKENLSGHVVREINQKSLSEVAKELNDSASTIRDGDDPTFKQIKKTFRYIPNFLTRLVIDLSFFLQYKLNIWSPILGTKKNTFGSIMITNVGTLGAEEAYVPFTPYSFCHAICCIGAIKEVPVYRDNEIKVGKIINFCWTLDHRLLDGSSACTILKTFTELFENPKKIEE